MSTNGVKTRQRVNVSSIRPVLLAAALALVSGANTLFNDFAYDDIPFVRDNPVVIGEAPASEIWTRDWCAHPHPWDTQRDLLYRPLTLFTFRLNYLVGGATPFGFHLVNVLLHAAVAGLVVVTTARLGCPPPGPLAAGALFAVMPIHVEAVAAIVGRADLLAALFTLTAVCIVLRRSSKGALVAVCLLGALLSKESGLAALILVPLFAVATGPRSRPAGTAAQSAIRDPQSAISSHPHSAFAIVASVASLALYLPLRYHALGGRLAQTTVPPTITNMLVDATAAERFWSAWQLFGLYVAKTFWPAKLCMDYSYKAISLADSPWHAHVLLGWTVFAGLIAGTVLWWRRGQRGLAVTSLAVLISYLPVSNTFFLIKATFGERMWYLPSAFLAIFIAAACTEGIRALRSRSVVAPRAAMAALLVVIGAGLGRGWIRNADWRDNAALFESAYRVHPTSAPVLHAYGELLVLRGDARGVELLERCVRIAPGLTDAQVALGRARLQQGAYAGALPHLQAAAMQQPAYPGLPELLRQASQHVIGERRTEIDDLRLNYHDNRDSFDLLLRLCETLIEAGAAAEAVEEFAAAAERFTGRPEFHRARAVALMTTGRRDEAIEAYRRCIALDTAPAAVLAELSMALLDRDAPGDAAEAAELLERAHRLAPTDAQVLIARAELLVLRGEREKAAAIYRNLINSLPAGERRAALEARLEILLKE